MFVLRARSPREFDYELLWGMLGVVLLVAAWTWPLWRETFSSACPMKSLFGIPCMLCGGTRAMHALTHGNIAEAVAMNPLVAVFSMALTAYAPYALAVALWPGAKRLRLARDAGIVRSRRDVAIRVGAACLLAANWAYLILSGR